ncbi:MAG: hypothetical protein PHW74_10635 [Desulfobacca sp.]|nr:hypothetical protein [Desulfobacca sp.]
MHKIINKLNPDYQKLALFTQAITSVDTRLPPLVVWDHDLLFRHWRKISRYLHWAGEPLETVESQDWIDQGIALVEAAAMYIWENNKAGYPGIMMPEQMQPEIRGIWERFRVDKVDLDAVKRIAGIALPILRDRLKY